MLLSVLFYIFTVKQTTMKKIILILTIALALDSCKKGEKCLVSGTWKVDKVHSDITKTTYDDGYTTVNFNSNGKVTIHTLNYEDVELNYVASDKEIIINNISTKYSCKNKSLTIYGDITKCGIGCINAQDGSVAITSYLSKH